MAARSSDNYDYRIKPGITVDRDVWEKFKEATGETNASQAVENFMRVYSAMASAGTPGPVEVLSSSAIGTITLESPEQWSVNYCNGTMNLTNTTPSVCSTGSAIVSPKSKTQNNSGEIRSIIIK